MSVSNEEFSQENSGIQIPRQAMCLKEQKLVLEMEIVEFLSESLVCVHYLFESQSILLKTNRFLKNILIP